MVGRSILHKKLYFLWILITVITLVLVRPAEEHLILLVPTFIRSDSFIPH